MLNWSRMLYSRIGFVTVVLLSVAACRGAIHWYTADSVAEAFKGLSLALVAPFASLGFLWSDLAKLAESAGLRKHERKAVRGLVRKTLVRAGVLTFALVIFAGLTAVAIQKPVNASTLVTLSAWPALSIYSAGLFYVWKIEALDFAASVFERQKGEAAAAEASKAFASDDDPDDKVRDVFVTAPRVSAPPATPRTQEPQGPLLMVRVD